MHDFFKSSPKLTRKQEPAFSSTLLVGIIFVVGTLILFSPISIKAQGPTNNSTNAQADGQEQNNKAIMHSQKLLKIATILPLNNILPKI